MWSYLYFILSLLFDKHTQKCSEIADSDRPFFYHSRLCFLRHFQYLVFLLLHGTERTRAGAMQHIYVFSPVPVPGLVGSQRHKWHDLLCIDIQILGYSTLLCWPHSPVAVWTCLVPQIQGWISFPQLPTWLPISFLHPLPSSVLALESYLSPLTWVLSEKIPTVSKFQPPQIWCWHEYVSQGNEFYMVSLTSLHYMLTFTWNLSLSG